MPAAKRAIIAEVFVKVAQGYGDRPAEANARLIAACPAMYDYVRFHADKGDADAKSIIEQIARRTN